MSFFASLGSEFGARRARMRAAFGDRTSSLIEFLFLGGFTCGVLAGLMGEWRGYTPLAAVIFGYILLDASRQRALAAGVDEVMTRKRQDKLAFVLFAGLAALGYAFLVLEQQDRATHLKPALPGEQFEVDIAPPS
jgi:hypothetical protein